MLIKKLQPLEAYFCTEGLVRLCTEIYKRPTRDNVKDIHMHITNYSLNKKSENYDDSAEEGTKRLFSKVTEQLAEENGIEPSIMKRQIKETIAKVVVAMIPQLEDYAKRNISSDISNIRCFQFLGFDIMMDQNLKAWLLEINANPSMNMYLERELPTGEREKTVSELDKHLKTLVLTDGIRIAKARKELDDLGCYEKLLPRDDVNYERFMFWNEIRTIFTKLGGLKNPDTLTSSQFQKLGRYPELTGPKLVKAQYDILYRQVTSENGGVMGLEEFFNAMEQMADKLGNAESLYDKMMDLLHLIRTLLK